MPTYLGMPSFPVAAKAAVADSQLRANLTHATHTIRAKRAGAVAELADWEQLRQAAKAIKDHTLAHLDTYLLRLEANVTRAGGHVHWAADADEANAIVAGLVRSAGADGVVKVKSMATQETGLNEALAADGIGALETDLAELIVQLGHDRPSHILVPAIHKNRAEIREIFRTQMPGAPAGLTDDPAALAAAARAHLRQAFLSASVGVSGANFAIAETGSLVVVESEGNGRMCLTLPRTLISVVGIEKILPSWRDLEVFLALLPRSSTAERMNPYTSTWTGITPGDGPQNFHLVLLDNGRTSALADQTGRQALRCIRCSACLNVCPVYERTGGHAYGSPYPGPIGAIISPLLRGVTSPADASLPYASTLCGACYEVCPVAINIPEALVHLRAKVVDAKSEKTFFSRTNHLPAVRPGAPLSPAARRGAARRAPRRQAGGQVRPDQAAAAAAERLDRNPRRPRPAAGIVPRLVGPDQGTGPMSSSRDQILARIRAANRACQAARPATARAPDGGQPGRRADVDAAYAALPREYLRAHHDPAVRWHRGPVRRAHRRLPRRRRAGPRGRPRRGRRPGPGRTRRRRARSLRRAGRAAARMAGRAAPGPSSWPATRRRSRRPNSTGWPGSSRAARSRSPRPARSSWTTAPARAAARSPWCPTSTWSSSGPARSPRTWPTRSPGSTRPARTP